MKLTGSCITDGANVVLYWPEFLSQDFDRQMQEGDGISPILRLQEKGRIIWFNCEGDGDYSAAFFIDEALPEELQTFCAEWEMIERLEVAAEGYFCGMEYMTADRGKVQREVPHFYNRVPVPAGIYHATVYDTRLPPHHERDWGIQQVGRIRYWLWQSPFWCVAMFALSLAGALFFWFKGGPQLAVAALVSCLLSGLVLWLLIRSEAFLKMDEKLSSYREYFPNYVVILRKLSNGSTASGE